MSSFASLLSQWGAPSQDAQNPDMGGAPPPSGPPPPPPSTTASGAPMAPAAGQPGTTKNFASSFVQGMAEAMQHHAGVKTQQEKQQEQAVFQQRQQSIDQAGQQIQSMEKYRQIQELIQRQKAEERPITDAMIANNPALAAFKGQFVSPKGIEDIIKSSMAGQSRENVAGTNKEAKLGAANIAAAGKSPSTNELYRRAVGGDPEAKAILAAQEQDKMRIAQARGSSYNASKIIGTVDPSTGELLLEPAGEAVAGGHVGEAAGRKVMGAQQQLEDVKAGVEQFRTAIQQMDREFTPAQRAKLTLAMRTPDDSIAKNLFTALLGTEQLTEKQQNVVIASQQAHERIFSVRNIAGLGHGNIPQQQAMQNMLPSVISADRNYAYKQLDAVKNQLDILQKGLPTLGRGSSQKAAAATPPAAPKRRVIDFTK